MEAQAHTGNLPSCSVATCSYNVDMETGIRDLKNHLSRYIQRIEAGESVVVTARDMRVRDNATALGHPVE